MDSFGGSQPDSSWSLEPAAVADSITDAGLAKPASLSPLRLGESIVSFNDSSVTLCSPAGFLLEATVSRRGTWDVRVWTISSHAGEGDLMNLAMLVLREPGNRGEPLVGWTLHPPRPVDIMLAGDLNAGGHEVGSRICHIALMALSSSADASKLSA